MALAVAIWVELTVKLTNALDTRADAPVAWENVMTGAPRKTMEASNVQLGQCAKAQGKRVERLEALRNGIGTYTDGEIRPCTKKQGIKCLKNEKQEAQTH